MARARIDAGRPYASPLIRPLALASTQWERGVAAACCLALGLVLIVEILTPDDVVGSIGFLPLIAAMWSLSSRLAAAVALAAAFVFWAVFATEESNRTTVLLIGAVGFVLAVLVRIYATRLDKLFRSAAGLSNLTVRTGDQIESLTRREVEVATLASRGLTAGEIGGELHISERTVESHLANAYAKLEIHSRSALRQLID
jgi:DNA-binding CsgD family transcriptional regulator